MPDQRTTFLNIASGDSNIQVHFDGEFHIIPQLVGLPDIASGSAPQVDNTALQNDQGTTVVGKSPPGEASMDMSYIPGDETHEKILEFARTKELISMKWFIAEKEIVSTAGTDRAAIDSSDGSVTFSGDGGATLNFDTDDKRIQIGTGLKIGGQIHLIRALPSQGGMTVAPPQADVAASEFSIVMPETTLSWQGQIISSSMMGEGQAFMKLSITMTVQNRKEEIRLI